MAFPNERQLIDEDLTSMTSWLAKIAIAPIMRWNR